MVINQLMGNAQDTLGEITGRSEQSANAEAFSRDFGTSDFDTFGGDLVYGKWIEIASFRVPADTEYSFGYGSAKFPENQGYLYFEPLADGTGALTDGDEVEGTLRLVVESSTGRAQHVVADYDTAKLDASKSNKQKMVPLPEQIGSPLATEDAYLKLKMNPNNAGDGASIDGDTEIIMPVTEYDLS